MQNKPKTQSEINDLEIELERLREKIHAIENQRNELVQRAKEIITLLKG